MAKDISYGETAREKLVKGVDAVANCVAKTLGPKGRNVVIGKPFGSPAIINDGVSIAKEIELKDPLENAGAQLLKEVSSKTNDAAGDGTTTASVLAQAIIHAGLNYIDEGSNPVMIKDGINKAARDVVEFIKNSSEEVDDNLLKQVASISAGNNEQVGELIADAIKQVGDDGVVTVEESNTVGTTLKSADGIQLDKGYLSPYFVTDPERMEAVLENPYILLVNKKINLIQDIVPILEQVARDGRSLLLIAEDVEGEALGSLVINVMRKVLRCVAIKSPGFGDGRKNTLEDLAVLTGGIVWTEEMGITLDRVGVEFFGKATRVIVTKDETTIVVDDSTKEAVEKHIVSLKKQKEDTDDDYQKEKIQQRIAKLIGGVAVIQVGAPTEVEMKEQKLRLEDALNATRAAKEEGIVAGGGYTLLQAQKFLQDKLLEMKVTDISKGYKILTEALSVPLETIATNAGFDGSIVIGECISKNLGFNALTGIYENLLETGVVDPAKVTRSVVENAASVAGMLLTTEAAIVEEPKPDGDESAFQPRGPMMM